MGQALPWGRSLHGVPVMTNPEIQISTTSKTISAASEEGEDCAQLIFIKSLNQVTCL